VVTESVGGYLHGVTSLQPGGPILQVELDVQGSTCLLTLRGVLSGGSLAALAAQVDQLGCLPCEEVVVDLGQVTGLDEAGAKVLLGLYYYVLGRGGALRVTGMAGPIAETLRATGAAELLPEGGPDQVGAG
jgi:anti-anti-sigma factor